MSVGLDEHPPGVVDGVHVGTVTESLEVVVDGLASTLPMAVIVKDAHTTDR